MRKDFRFQNRDSYRFPLVLILFTLTPKPSPVKGEGKEEEKERKGKGKKGKGKVGVSLGMWGMSPDVNYQGQETFPTVSGINTLLPYQGIKITGL